MSITDTDLLTQIRSRAIELVTVNNGLKGQDLHMKLMAEFERATNDYFERAVSELVMSNDIIRIEYSIPNKYFMYHTLYLPLGSRIV